MPIITIIKSNTICGKQCKLFIHQKAQVLIQLPVERIGIFITFSYRVVELIETFFVNITKLIEHFASIPRK